MRDLLLKIFVKNYTDPKNAKVRGQLGKLSSIVGIIVNLFLSAAKFTVGTLFNSISITGDAVNNLSDAGSSVISLVSFKMSGKPADKRHPFGHARIEYIAASIVAFIILMVGFELIKTSYNKIIHPEAVEFSYISVGVLAFSILAKLWLCRFYTNIGKRIGSAMMQATAADSLSDVLTTSTVLVSTVLSPIIKFQLDGYMGIGVAIFIMISGIKIIIGTMDNLMGKEPADELTSQIDAYIRKYPGVIQLHDLIVHDYGPQRCFATVHVEVNAKEDILVSHDLIDNIERDISMDMGIHLVIHLDPIVIDDPIVSELYHVAKQAVKSVDDSLRLHGFRVVKGTTHTNMIFDILVPYECKKSDSHILDEITNVINKIDENLFLVITFDRAYVSNKNHTTLQ